MKIACTRVAAVAALASLILLPGAERGYAQYRSSTRPSRGVHAEPKGEGAEGAAVLRLRKLEGLGKKNQVKTPVYQVTYVLPSIKRPGEWTEIKLTYDTNAEWIDELTIQFFALAESKSKGKLAYTLYRKTVRNMDVERGEGHLATVFLPPNALKRYGAPLAIAAEVSIAGKTVGVIQDVEKSVKLPEEWWKSDKITQSEGVTIRDDYLLTREQSPFGLVAIDDYEGSR